MCEHPVRQWPLPKRTGRRCDNEAGQLVPQNLEVRSSEVGRRVHALRDRRTRRRTSPTAPQRFTHPGTEKWICVPSQGRVYIWGSLRRISHFQEKGLEKYRNDTEAKYVTPQSHRPTPHRRYTSRERGRSRPLANPMGGQEPERGQEK